MEKTYEPECIFLVLNNYYETLKQLDGSFIAWHPHFVHLHPDLIKFVFNLLIYSKKII